MLVQIHICWYSGQGISITRWRKPVPYLWNHKCVCVCCMTLSIHIKWIHMVLPHVRHFHHQVRKTLTPFVHVADALSLEDKNTRWLQSNSSKRDESGKHYGSQRGMRAAHTRVYARPTLRHRCQHSHFVGISRQGIFITRWRKPLPYLWNHMRGLDNPSRPGPCCTTRLPLR